MMADILAFRPRPRPSADRLATTDQLDIRAELEAAAQDALDTADRLIAILDGIGGDVDDEDCRNAEPSLGAPEGHESQVVWLRGTMRDLDLR